MPNGSITVLVADDSAVYRRGMVRAVMTTPPLELVGQVADGREALSALAEMRPDIALLDIRMPGLDGIEVCRRHRAEDPQSPTRFVLISASADDTVLAQARDAGAALCLSKKHWSWREVCEAVIGLPPGRDAAVPPAGDDDAGGASADDGIDTAVVAEARAMLGEEFADLVREWHEEAEAVLARLRDPGAAGDLPALATALHKLAGGSLALGATRVAEVARAVEEPAKAGTSPDAAAADGLARAVRDARAALDRA